MLKFCEGNFFTSGACTQVPILQVRVQAALPMSALTPCTASLELGQVGMVWCGCNVGGGFQKLLRGEIAHFRVLHIHRPSCQS